MKRVVPGLMLMTLLLCSGTCIGAPVAAAVSGVVRDAHGTPQMGALVQLLTGDATAIVTTFTDDHGRYIIPAVLPGRYQLRATAAFLMPATRANLSLRAGAQTIVNLTMTTLFEAENWLPAQRRRGDESEDDWKWTLRSTANRPLLRLADNDDTILSVSSSAETHHKASSQARLTMTSGDGAFAAGGVHQVLVLNSTQEDGDGAILRADIGNPPHGYLGPSVDASAGYEKRLPLGGATRLVSTFQSHPELAYGKGAGLQVLRLASTQQMRLGDAVLIDAGTLLEAERLASLHLQAEPFVRAAVRPSPGYVIEYRFAGGRNLQSSEDLDRVKPSIDVVADAAGRPLRAESRHHEISVTHKMGSRVLAAAAYADRSENAVISGSGLFDAADLPQMDVIADPTTQTFRVRSAGFSSRGVSASLIQPITPSLAAYMEYDLGTALRGDLHGVTLKELRPAVAAHTSQAVSVSVRGKVLRTGTNLRAEYRWQPERTLTQVNAFNVNPQSAYLGFYVRQRLWCSRVFPGGIDAVVEATNLLEQGYQPVLAPDGHTLYLAQVPRAIQGGLAFNF